MRLIGITTCVGIVAFLSALRIAAATSPSPVTILHKQPPKPCLVRSFGGGVPLAPIIPEGSSDPIYVDHMFKFGAIYLAFGWSQLDPSKIELVYTSFFDLGHNEYEVGVYGYQFSKPLDRETLRVREHPDAQVHFLSGNFVAFVWHDGPKPNECFDAINNALEGK